MIATGVNILVATKYALLPKMTCGKCIVISMKTPAPCRDVVDLQTSKAALNG